MPVLGESGPLWSGLLTKALVSLPSEIAFCASAAQLFCHGDGESSDYCRLQLPSLSESDPLDTSFLHLVLLTDLPGWAGPWWHKVGGDMPRPAQLLGSCG